MGGRGSSSNMGGRGGSSGMQGKGGGGGNLSDIESKIRDDSVETAALIGPDGTVLFDKSDGLPGAVYFTKEEVSMMKNGILTHNHPSGTTFSPEDVSMAVNSGLKEIRAVHSNGVYSLTRQFDVGGTVPSKYLNFSSHYEKAANDYMRNTVDAIYSKTGDADRCNKMVADFRRQWLKENSASYGWTYKESGR